MDAVELPLLTVSKHLTNEGFGREGKVDGREPITSVPVFGGSSSVSRFSSSSTDAKCTVTALGQNSFSRNKMTDAGVCMEGGVIPSFGGETVARQITVNDPNNSFFLLPKCMDNQMHRKGVKPSKSNSLCSKRPRYEQVEGSLNHAKQIHGNTIYRKHGSSLTECTEKSRFVGQKHNLDGKRGDRKTLKQHSKTKYDSFLSKVGFVNTSCATVGGNILGIYGLKSDTHDVTKDVDELSLNDLLDGSCKYPSPCKDKGKKAASTNENLLQIVKKACSILRPRRVLPQQNATEEDTNCNRKTDTCALGSGSSAISATECSKSDTCNADQSSKDSCTTSSTSSLYPPNEILERLALPPKDLDSLLLDTFKPAMPSRSNTDLRNKAMLNGASLPPFSWSQCFNGPSKTVIDTGRLSTNRSRWVRIGSIASSHGDTPSSFADLDSITCDHKKFVKGLDATSEPNLPQRHQNSFDGKLKFSLDMGNFLRAPEAEGKLTRHENNMVSVSPLPDQLQFLENVKLEKSEGRISSNFASSSHNGGCDQHQWPRTSENLKAAHSPKLLAAAQILYEIARYSGAHDQNGKLRWPKKPSQKSMKARKSRSSTGKTEVMFATPKASIAFRDSFEITDQITPSKKLKLSSSNRRKDSFHTNTEGREHLNWSIPTSSRSPPIRSETVETLKQFGMMPSSKRVLDKSCNGEQKLRKAVVVEWSRGRIKKEG